MLVSERTRPAEAISEDLHEQKQERESGTGVPKLLITSRMQTRIRGTSRCGGGGFAKQVAGNVEKGETATLLRERLETMKISTVSSLA